MAVPILFGCAEVYQIPTGRVFIPEDNFAGRTLKLKLGIIKELHTRNIGYEYEIVHHQVIFTAKNDSTTGHFLPCDPNQAPDRLARTTPPGDGNSYSSAVQRKPFRIALKRLDPTLGPGSELVGPIFFKSGSGQDPEARCNDCKPIVDREPNLVRPLGIWIPPESSLEISMECEFYRGAVPYALEYEGQRQTIDPRPYYEAGSMDILENYRFQRKMAAE
tara:strand:+ start:209 stop:865 length:657 start_codon:yes stop_codon:yes gene_type:complete